MLYLLIPVQEDDGWMWENGLDVVILSHAPVRQKLVQESIRPLEMQ